MPTFNGMQFSYNNGADWKVIYQASTQMNFLQLGPLVKPFRRILYWTKQGNVGYNNVVCASNDGGITIYNNNGNGFNFESLGTPGDYYGCWGLATSPLDSLTCYALLKYKQGVAGYGAQVYKTTDGGATWDLLPLAPPSPTQCIQIKDAAGIVVSATDPNRVYAYFGTGNGGSTGERKGVAYSGDAGASWEWVEEADATNIPEYIGPYSLAIYGNSAILSVRKERASGGSSLFKLAGGDYIGPQFPGGSGDTRADYHLRRSKLGVVFAVRHAVEDPSANTMKVSYYDGGEFVDAGGNGLPSKSADAEVGYNGSSLFADVHHDGLYFSADAGAAFTQAYAAASYYSGKTIPDPLNERYTWFCGSMDASNQSGIFVSKDNGVTWLVRRTNTGDIPPFAIGAMPPDV